MKTRILKGLIFLIVMTLFLISTSGIWAQASGTGTSLIPPEVIDENELFGGPKDIVTVIDPSVASAERSFGGNRATCPRYQGLPGFLDRRIGWSWFIW